VEIVGTSITAVHRTHGHYYTTHWHVDLPYLTNQVAVPTAGLTEMSRALKLRHGMRCAGSLKETS
jgi:hypothetical protein